MFRRLTMVSVLIAFPMAAVAQARPNTLGMSCANAAGLVSRAGAIVLGTGPHIYDRYVASRAFCQPDEQTEPRWLATADTPRCFVGYGCERRYGDPADR